jgi:hypothetical protein
MGYEFNTAASNCDVSNGELAAMSARLVEPFCDALRHHSLGGGGVDRADLVSECDAEAGEVGTVGPLCGLPNP